MSVRSTIRGAVLPAVGRWSYGLGWWKCLPYLLPLVTVVWLRMGKRAVISVRLFSVFLGCGCVGGFNLNRQPFARLQYSPVVALSPLWRCGCSSARCRLSVVALWRFPCRFSLFARCSADKKPTKGAKFPSAPLFRPRWAVAPPWSLPCRVGSLSASLRCHPLRLEGVGFLVVRGLSALLVSGLGSVQPLGGRLEAVALLAGVILEGVGLGGEFAVE